MNPDCAFVPPDDSDDMLLERLRSAAEFLELIDVNRGLLDRLPAPDRERLHVAIAQVYNPDPAARRRRQKAAERERSAAKAERDGAVLHETGIRTLRRQPVFNTPNVFPPEGFVPRDIETDEPERRESIELQHCYVCKQKYTVIHHFYDQMCPECGDFNFMKR